MRLADFIDTHTEAILLEWENFARTLKPATTDMTVKELRNDAESMLKMIAEDLRTTQTEGEQIKKSQGHKPGEHDDAGHGLARMGSRFTIEQLVSEYRALRSSVLRLWARISPLKTEVDIDDIIRFNESIDQLMAASVFSFAAAKHKVDQEEDERRRNFLAMLGHELRNPLSPISSAADLLKSESGNNPKIEKVSIVISRQVKHMVSLVNDLLDVGRITKGIIELKLEEIDLRVAISDAVEQIRPVVEARRQKLDIVTTQEPALVQADKDRIVQIITNVLSNATKYTPTEGHVKLTLILHACEAEILVEDNGQGMSPEFLPQAFDLFAQAARSSNRSDGGLGLGLSLVKNLVELHGGEIFCKSDGIGKGSHFTIRLPRLPMP